MASTYSQNLRVELIGNGEQASVWGNTTNRNLGTLLEGAIAGHSTVSITSADQALTALSGAADQARQAAISLTTTTTANFNVYVPPASKLYVIRNTTAYVATIYNSTVIGNTTAAGAGVAIPAGRTMTVWTDGTVVRVQSSHHIGTVVGDVVGDVTGNLEGNLTAAAPTAPTAAPGTNTTQVATTAFVQAAATAALQALHPIGSIYTSTVSTNPGTLLGFGTWVAFGAGRVLIGNGGGFSAGATGGSADAVVVSHTHTASTAITDPGHRHRIAGGQGGAVQILGSQSGTVAGIAAGTSGGYVDTYAGTPILENSTTGITAATTVNSTGASGTNANLQPYIVVYMWNRTA